MSIKKIKKKISKLIIELKSLISAIEQASSQYSEIEPEAKERKTKSKKK